MALPLSMSVCDYDRTARAVRRPRADRGLRRHRGAAGAGGILPPRLQVQEFDVTEISMSSYLLTTARGDAHYVAIPAFVSRLFRHSGIYIRTDRGIKSPQDLRAKQSACRNTR